MNNKFKLNVRKFRITAILTVLVFFLTSPTFAQTVQTVRGRVVERNTQEPLPGVNIVITDADGQVRGVSTDANGLFSIGDVPVGRCHIRASMIGFAPFAANNVLVYSGRETVVDIALEELVSQLGEVIVTPQIDKSQPLNRMATVSARMLSSEEANRYAGSWGDPARMVSNLAGVAVANDTRNDIIIRGNSPMGVLWRLDGFDIPNPNHFGAMGGTGGPIGMINNNQLTNSDFFTGAFPAEFGNATSGVFDLRLRNGNANRHEFLGSVGFNGFELGAEGPISRNTGASYMINARYSFLEFLSMFMPIFGVPKYQDLCAKVNIPLRSGNLSVVALLGANEIETREDMLDDLITWQPGDEGQDMKMSNSQVFTGVNYTARFSASTRLENRFSYQYFSSALDMDVFVYPETTTTRPWLFTTHSEGRMAWTSTLHHRFDSRNFLMVGTGADYFMTRLDSRFYEIEGAPPHIEHDANKNSTLLKGFTQWQHRISDRFSITPGVYAHLFTFNGDFSIEPRLGMRWTLNERSSVSFGTGLHSQLPPRLIIFYKDANGNRPNERLGMSRSWQTVAGYDLRITDGMRLKTEIYYQHLYNIPVTHEYPAESILNLGVDFYNNWNFTYVNSGTGRNYGIELTLEKFFDDNYYFLITGSLYDARYRGYDGVERHSAFAGNFALNVVAGYEWKLSRNRLLSVNAKVAYMGARRYTPVSIDRFGGTHVFDWERAYTQRLPVYFRADLGVNMKRNYERVAIEWFFEVTNLTNRQNVWQQVYNTSLEEYQRMYQFGFMPMGGVRVYF